MDPLWVKYDPGIFRVYDIQAYLTFLKEFGKFVIETYLNYILDKYILCFVKKIYHKYEGITKRMDKVMKEKECKNGQNF